MDRPENGSEAMLSSFQAFRSEVSRFLSPILSKAKPGSDFFSLEWIHSCFDVIPLIHRAFSKLVVDIDYPMSKWKAAASEEYLNYSLNVLELLNKVSSSLAQLGHARLSMSHALAIHENLPSLASERLQEIGPHDPGSSFKEEESKEKKENIGFGKEPIIHEALMIIKRTGILLFGIIISGLCSDGSIYTDMRMSALEMSDSSLKNLDSIFSQEISLNGCVIKEVKEINEAAATTAQQSSCDSVVQELNVKLEAFERSLQSLGEKKERLFSEVLEARNQLLDTFRLRPGDAE